MAKRRIRAADGVGAVREAQQAIEAGEQVARPVLATAVRFLLEELTERFPGNTLEVRVPPFGAAQCVEGPRHTRGTPPNVIECDAETWIALALGQMSWQQALAEHRATASGTRADLTDQLPLMGSTGNGAA